MSWWNELKDKVYGVYGWYGQIRINDFVLLRQLIAARPRLAVLKLSLPMRRVSSKTSRKKEDAKCGSGSDFS